MLPVSRHPAPHSSLYSDLDILAFYIGGSLNAPKAVSSFGSLFHFKPQKKPQEANGATRCLDCAAEATCPYSAKKAYIEPLSDGSLGNVSHPSSVAHGSRGPIDLSMLRFWTLKTLLPR